MSNTTVNHKCPACHANLKFNPKEQNWCCEYCDSVFELKDLKKNTHKYVEKKVKPEDTVENKEYNLYKCPDCGAQIVTDLNTSATFCVYCKNTSIIKERLTGKFEPKYILPFQNTQEDAIEAFKKVGKKHPLMPKTFNSKKNISEIRGIYIPFWLFTSTTNGSITKNGTKIKTWRVGNYRYTKTDTYNIIREGNVNFEYVPNDGSKKFDDAIMHSIEPFDYKKLKEFSPSYLSGFLAEKYDITDEEAKQQATNRMKNTIKNLLENDITGYLKTAETKSNFTFTNLKTHYVLLPVWLLNIKYKDKMYTFAMNGETGKLIGNMPVDPKKAFLTALTIFIISFITCIIIFYLFIRGNV